LSTGSSSAASRWTPVMTERSPRRQRSSSKRADAILTVNSVASSTWWAEDAADGNEPRRGRQRAVIAPATMHRATPEPRQPVSPRGRLSAKADAWQLEPPQGVEVAPELG